MLPALHRSSSIWRNAREVLTISGLGTWPAAASVELFEREYDGHIPIGLLRTVVPAAPDAWILALEEFGTMSFATLPRPPSGLPPKVSPCIR